MEPLMSKSPISLGAAAAVVIAALCLPAAADASTDQPATAATAKKHPKKHVSQVVQAQRPGQPQQWQPRGCTWPYTNQYPPCQSTWPAGDPHYHGGSHPGPTFDSDY
jgi:hypothetical protein